MKAVGSSAVQEVSNLQTVTFFYLEPRNVIYVSSLVHNSGENVAVV